MYLPLRPSAEGVLSYRLGGWAGGRLVPDFAEPLSQKPQFLRSKFWGIVPAVAQRHGNFPIFPIWTYPWAQNWSNLSPVGSTHYCGVIMGAMASLITSPTSVYSTVHSGADQRKTSKLRVTGLCAGNSPETGEFPAQMASNAENVSIWWRHHGLTERISPKPLGRFPPFKVLWNCLGL